MTRSAYRMRLSAAIFDAQGSAARWVTATPVSEAVKGGGAWSGEVQTFELLKRSKAKYCYAWANDIGDDTEVVMVLKIPPVDSPATAVREYLASKKPAPKAAPSKK